jgi:hypothetical protein
VFFEFLPKHEMMRNENRYFGRHFEKVKNMVVFSGQIYGVAFIEKFMWESGFFSLTGKKYLMHLSFNSKNGMLVFFAGNCSAWLYTFR